jgi:hypothetical protein
MQAWTEVFRRTAAPTIAIVGGSERRPSEVGALA